MRRRRRTLAEVSRWRIRVAVALTHQFMERVVLPRARSLRETYGSVDWDFKDLYAALRYAALRTAASYRTKDGTLRRVVWRRLRWALKEELSRQWYLPEPFRARWYEIGASQGWPTAELLPPRTLSEITDPTPDCLTHLIDDLPDRFATSTHEAALARIRSDQVHQLLARLPRRFRGPVWHVYALGEDEWTAAQALGLRLPVCWALAREGLARLQRLVADDPSLLVPLDD